jgi:hypothetical protein
MNNFDHIISLGYVCNIASYLRSSGKRDKAYVFDRFATPMWAVNELLSNGFSDFLKKENIKSDVLFDNTTKQIAYDSKYYMRLPMSAKSLERRYDQFASKMNERKDRFMSILNGNESVLFIRDEEPSEYADMGKRVSFPEYETKYSKKELEYVYSFCDFVKKTYPQLDFKVLYLNSEGKFSDNNVIGIPKCEADYRDGKIGKKMTDHINSHSEFLNNNL